jgi:hypothetical protein
MTQRTPYDPPALTRIEPDALGALTLGELLEVAPRLLAVVEVAINLVSERPELRELTLADALERIAR